MAGRVEGGARTKTASADLATILPIQSVFSSPFFLYCQTVILAEASPVLSGPNGLETVGRLAGLTLPVSNGALRDGLFKDSDGQSCLPNYCRREMRS